MKRIFLLISALALVVSTASAWSAVQNEAVVLLAKKSLTPDALAMVQDYLGDSYTDDVDHIYRLEKQKQSPYTNTVHSLYLDSSLQPMKVEGDDAYTALNSALVVVKDRYNREKRDVVEALRVIINLVCDIHNFANVRIQGIEHSQSDFLVQVYKMGNAKEGGEITKTRWSRYWGGYSSFHKAYSGAYWAKDFEICYGVKNEEFTKGNLNDWVLDIGQKSAEMYKIYTPTNVVPRIVRLQHEDIAHEMVAKSGYRLAVLLNEASKL